MKRPHEIYQFDLLYALHITIENNWYAFSTGADVKSRETLAKPLDLRKSKDTGFAFKAIFIKKDRVLRYQKIVHCDDISKSNSKKLLEKLDVKSNRTATKYRHSYTSIFENFYKDLAIEIIKQTNISAQTSTSRKIIKEFA